MFIPGVDGEVMYFRKAKGIIEILPATLLEPFQQVAGELMRLNLTFEFKDHRILISEDNFQKLYVHMKEKKK